MSDLNEKIEQAYTQGNHYRNKAKRLLTSVRQRERHMLEVLSKREERINTVITELGLDVDNIVESAQ